MERLMDMLRGRVLLRVEGANTALLLNKCSCFGIEFWDVRRDGEFQLLLTVRRRDEKRVSLLAQRCGCVVKLALERGLPGRVRFLRGRGVLCISTLMILGMLFWSSFYIWNIDVKGNECVPTGEILNALEDSGVAVGSFWPGFTADNIRSRVLAKLPELRWITVNVNGSNAQVIVRERIPVPELYHEKDYADVVAECAGMVEEVLALNGVALVKKGDTVAEGDVLISGEAENLMEETRYLHALGSVRARTWHTLTAVCPLEVMQKGEDVKEIWRFSVGLPNRLVKIYPNSGILPTDCGKITLEEVLGISQIFVLPIELRAEHMEKYSLLPMIRDPETAAEGLEEVLMEELALRIGESGKILSHAFSTDEKDGLLYVTLRAECLQEIGSTRERVP